MTLIGILWLFILAGAAQAGVVVDRMAVVVAQHVIKASDVDHDLRLTQFINREPLKINSQEKRRSAERLIDQEIIRQEILTSGVRRPPEAEGAALEEQLLRDRFAGAATRLRDELKLYGLTRDELRAHLLWQLAVLSFIDQRFKAGASVSQEEVRTYYDQHLPELRRQYPADSSFEMLEPKLRESLEGERVNQNFNQWLEEARTRTKIVYKQEAFQ